MSVVGARSRNPEWVRHWLAFAATFALAVFADHPTARADCVVVNATTISCTGATFNYAPGSLTGTTITVQPGANVTGTGGTDAIRIDTATAVTLSNLGLIDGRVVFIGTADFSNAGVLQMTDPTTAGTNPAHSIPGTFTQTAAGTLAARVDAFGNADGLFAVDAFLNGKFIAVVQPGLYTAPVAFSAVITLGGTVYSPFSSHVSTSPFLRISADYSNPFVANITLTPIAFNAVPRLTPNQKAVADALTANYSGSVTGNAATLYSNLFAATSVSVFDQLSGAGTSATQGTAFVMGNAFLSMFGQGGFPGGGSGLGGAPLGYADAEKPDHPALGIIKLKPRHEIARRWQTWAAGFGATRSVDGDAAAGTFGSNQSGAGGAAGVIYRPDTDLALGAAAGASKSHFSVSDLSTSGDLTAAHLGVHAAKRWGAFYATAAITYARIDNDITRTITGVGPTETATGSFASDLLAGRIEIGWRNELGRYALTPFATVQYSELWQHSYSETSTTTGGAPGILGLSYAAQAVSSFPASLGVQFDSRFDLANGLSVTPYARLAWLHEFEPDSRIDASFISVPGASFTVAGARAASDAAKIDSGLRLALNEQTALSASFNSELAGHSRSYAGTGGLRVTW